MGPSIGEVRTFLYFFDPLTLSVTFCHTYDYPSRKGRPKSIPPIIFLFSLNNLTKSLKLQICVEKFKPLWSKMVNVLECAICIKIDFFENLAPMGGRSIPSGPPLISHSVTYSYTPSLPPTSLVDGYYLYVGLIL